MKRRPEHEFEGCATGAFFFLCLFLYLSFGPTPTHSGEPTAFLQGENNTVQVVNQSACLFLRNATNPQYLSGGIVVLEAKGQTYYSVEDMQMVTLMGGNSSVVAHTKTLAIKGDNFTFCGRVEAALFITGNNNTVLVVK